MIILLFSVFGYKKASRQGRDASRKITTTITYILIH